MPLSPSPPDDLLTDPLASTVHGLLVGIQVPDGTPIEPIAKVVGDALSTLPEVEEATIEYLGTLDDAPDAAEVLDRKDMN